VLRHDPAHLGLELDRHGWVSVADLIRGAERRGLKLDEATLRRIVSQDSKVRFTLDEDGGRIRANYGHSVPIEMELEPFTPPELLFHGTASRFLAAIERDGILPRGRQYVHLSPDQRTARRVGRRHGRPIVLPVEAARMCGEGCSFYLTPGGTWLTSEVPREFIRL